MKNFVTIDFWRNILTNLFLYSNVSLELQQKNTRKWLKERYTEKTKDFYVKTKAQLQAQYDVENVFFKFDDDCSGTLDCGEL